MELTYLPLPHGQRTAPSVPSTVTWIDVMWDGCGMDLMDGCGYIPITYFGLSHTGRQSDRLLLQRLHASAA